MTRLSVSMTVIVPLLFVLSLVVAYPAAAAPPPPADGSACPGSACPPGGWRRAAPGLLPAPLEVVLSGWGRSMLPWPILITWRQRDSS